MKKRILIVSDSIQRHTGYATVARNIIQNLPLDQYEIAQAAMGDISELNVDLPIHYYTALKDHSNCCNNGFLIEYKSPEKQERTFIQPQVYIEEKPATCLKGHPVQPDSYMYDSIFYIIQHFKPDIVIPINDLWGIYNIALLSNRKNFKLAPYLAVDSECFFASCNAQRKDMPKMETVPTLSTCDKVIVFTNWAKDVLNKTCSIVHPNSSFSNIEVIPHGVDISKWKPLNKKAELREKWFGKIENINNVFLVGSMNRNQSRKGFDLIIASLRKFIDVYEKKGGPKIMCYFHCLMQEQIGWDLPWLAEYYGVKDRCIFNNSIKPGLGFPTEDLNEIANCFDAHITLPNSEGWALCVDPETYLHTKDSVTKIKDININQQVLTHTGSYKNINDITNKYVDTIYEVSAYHVLPTKVTVEHPYYSITRKNVNTKLFTPEWKNVTELNKHDYLALIKPKYNNILPEVIKISDYIDVDLKDNLIINKNSFSSSDSAWSYKTMETKYNVPKHILETIVFHIKNNTIPRNNKLKELKNRIISDGFIIKTPKSYENEIKIDNEFLDFCGWYLAEGSSEDGKRINIDLHKDEFYIAEKLGQYLVSKFGGSYSSGIDQNKSFMRYSDSTVALFFQTFLGKFAKNKKIPFILENGSDKLGILFKALFSGDGHLDSKTKTYQLTTISPSLAIKTRDILLSNNILSSLRSYINSSGNECFTVTVTPHYINRFLNWIGLDITFDISNRNKKAIELDNMFLIPIKSITKHTGSYQVYDINVGEDHSFFGNGVVLHNTPIETMAAGIPNISTKYSAHADWGKEAILFVKTGAFYHEPATGFIKAVADIDSVAKQLSLFRDSPKMRDEYSRRGLNLTNKLQWSNVVKQWVTLINSIDISDLQENRYKLFKTEFEELKVIDLPTNVTEEEFEVIEI